MIAVAHAKIESAVKSAGTFRYGRREPATYSCKPNETTAASADAAVAHEPIMIALRWLSRPSD